MRRHQDSQIFVLQLAAVILQQKPQNSNPKEVVNLILFGKAIYRKIIQNLIWATGYSIIALPLAAGVLYNQGILLSTAAVEALVKVITVTINASLKKIK